MKVLIKQNELYKAINIVQKAVSSRTTLPILSGILMEAYDNKLHFTATDLELGINTFIECEVEEEGAIVVHSRLIGEFTRKLPTNSFVNITTNENNNFEIKCLNSDFNILGNSAKEFPSNTFYNEGNTFNISSDTLKRLIKYTSFAVSQDNMKPVFTGCLMEIKDNICSFATLDGFRLALKSEEVFVNEDVTAIIPTKALSEVVRIIGEDEYDVEVTVSDSHISFNVENTTIISSLLEGKFLDYKGLLKDEYMTKITINAQELKGSLERASLLAREDKNNLIIFDIKENTVQINSASEYGNAEEMIILKEKTGDDLKIGFNSKYILDVLRVVESEDITIKFLGKINPCFINEADNEDFTYMALPVRIS